MESLVLQPPIKMSSGWGFGAPGRRFGLGLHKHVSQDFPGSIGNAHLPPLPPLHTHTHTEVLCSGLAFIVLTYFY